MPDARDFYRFAWVGSAVLGTDGSRRPAASDTSDATFALNAVVCKI